MSEFGDPLSPRELDVLREVAQGTSNKEIAQALVISPNTVKVHLRNLFAKLGASSRTELVTLAMREGILEPQVSDAPDDAIMADDETVDKAPSHNHNHDGKQAIQHAKQDAPVFSPVETAVAPVPERVAPAPQRRWLWPAVALLAVMLIGGGWAYWRGQSAAPSNATMTEPTADSTENDFSPTVLDENGSWTQLRPRPDPAAHFAMVSSGLDLYQIGGETTATVTGQSMVYDTQINAWRLIADKPTPVADMQAVLLAGQIYVPGGRTADGSATAAMEVYSPSNDAWRSAQSLPQPIYGAVTLVSSDAIYLLGGWDGSAAVDTVYVYDPSADAWRPLAPLPTARAYAVGGLINDALIVVGGYDGEQDLDVCEQYDPVSDSWSDCPAMLVPRGGAGGLVLFDRLYVLGGGMTDSVPYGEVYDGATEAWQVVNVPLFESPEQWTHFGTALVENTIYLAGGRIGEQMSAEQYGYNLFPYRSYFPAIEKEE